MTTPETQADSLLQTDIKSLRARVLAEFKRHPNGLTDGAVARLLDIQHRNASARRKELERKGEVVDTGKRVFSAATQRQHAVYGFTGYWAPNPALLWDNSVAATLTRLRKQLRTETVISRDLLRQINDLLGALV